MAKRYEYTGEEEFIGEHDKAVIEAMIADMTAPKHRFIKDLTYKPAIKFACDWARDNGKKSLSPMVNRLQRYLADYDKLLSSYSSKKPYNDLYEQKKHKFHMMEESIEEKSFLLRFSGEELQNNYSSISDQRRDDLTGHYWDSLFIQSCIDPEYKITRYNGSFIPSITIAQKYLCICTICGNMIEALSSDFRIDYEYGIGYYPRVCCDKCHSVSSFEAKTMDILNKQGIDYRREVSFIDLVSESGAMLRFDFALYDPEKLDEYGKPQYKLMIELQGPHHYKPGKYNEYGDFVEDNSEEAKKQYKVQIEDDRRKETFCKDKGVSLECIKYTSGRSYEELAKKIKDILVKYGMTV